jgi:uncharacterized protein YndB with AHSA1/START domain
MSEVDVTVRIAAPPNLVFRYFVDPDRMRLWMGVTVDADARPGGHYRVDVTGAAVAVGEFVEVVPDERVVWTWGWEGDDHGVPPGSTTVEVTLTPDGDATVVRLRHLGLPDADAAERHRAGWTHYAARLAVAAAGGDPGADELATPA